MHARLIIVIVSLLLTGCATGLKSKNTERNFNAASLIVDLNSEARQTIEAIPAESAMDSFEMIDSQGRAISYIAFTDTDTGALIFVDHKLYGTLSRRDAQAFYICRGHSTATPNHWASKATEWAAGLLANSQPATRVELQFSGKSTAQSIKEVAESPFLRRLKLLFSMGSKPLSIFSSINSTRNDIEESSQFEKITKGLGFVRLGMSESSVTEVAEPEDISFTSDGIVMSYPRHLIEYYITEGKVKVIQRPSFDYLSKRNAALFYLPNTQWSRCTPNQWKKALAEQTSSSPASNGEVKAP